MEVFFIVTLFLSEDMARDYLFTGRFLCLVSELRIVDVASNLLIFVYRLFLLVFFFSIDDLVILNHIFLDVCPFEDSYTISQLL